MCFIELASPSNLTIRQYLHRVFADSDKAAMRPVDGEFVIGHLLFFICHLWKGNEASFHK
jgi:hypothetical protein